MTVIDPRAAEAEMGEDFKDARFIGDIERVAAKRIEKQLKRGKDVPLVEDFPLAPEEETPDFQDLPLASGSARCERQNTGAETPIWR